MSKIDWSNLQVLSPVKGKQNMKQLCNSSDICLYLVHAAQTFQHFAT